jgi:hypothetical protein
MTDRLIWIVSKLEDDYHVLCAGISYECIVIGTPQICGDANPKYGYHHLFGRYVIIFLTVKINTEKLYICTKQ